MNIPFITPKKQMKKKLLKWIKELLAEKEIVFLIKDNEINVQFKDGLIIPVGRVEQL